MTHQEYLDAHLELSDKGLVEIALMLGQARYDDATTATTNLRAMLDDLWEQRRVTAEREVQP